MLWLDVGGREKGEGRGEGRKRHHPMHGTYPVYLSLTAKVQVKSPDPRCTFARAEARACIAALLCKWRLVPGFGALFCLCMDVSGSRALEGLPRARYC